MCENHQLERTMSARSTETMTPEQLREALARHGVTQGELARRLGMSDRKTVHRWATGERTISTAMIKAIRHVLECEIHEDD